MRKILILIITLLYTIITYPLRMLNNRKDTLTKENNNYMLLRRLICIALFITGIKINIKDIENFDENSTYLIICNHKSNLDAMLLVYLFKKPITFICKKELRSVPLLGSWFQDIGCLFMDRENARQATIIINTGAKTLEGKKSVLIFPEGTRVEDDRIGEFKSGSFKLAIKSNVDILPITIFNSNKILGRGNKLTKGEVSITIGQPIRWKNTNIVKTQELSDYTKDIIEDLYLQAKC